MKIKYCAHIANVGWQPEVEDGQVAGTVGEAKAMEAYRITAIEGLPEGTELGVAGHAYVQDMGWSDATPLGWDVGSTGLNKHLEAVKIGLTGKDKDKYEIWYRLHVANYGFLDWSHDGEVNGTTGGNNAAEAIQIMIAEKGKNFYPTVDSDFAYRDLTPPPEPPKPAVDKRAALINAAQSYVGYVSGSNNDSVFGRYFEGANAGAWCCYYVRKCCLDAGVTFPATGYCPTVVDWAKDNGLWTQTPEPGYIVLYDFNGNDCSDHIGIVVQVYSQYDILAAEGNTGSPVGVYRKRRSSGILGYVKVQ